MTILTLIDGRLEKPLIRWAGGKRLLVRKLLKFLPRNYGTYFEPMIGSGALFFSLSPKRAVLADVNPELINFYTVIKTNPHEFYDMIGGPEKVSGTFFRCRNLFPLRVPPTGYDLLLPRARNCLTNKQRINPLQHRPAGRCCWPGAA